MSNRQARREQSRQARRQATSYRGGGRSRGSSQGGGDSGGSGGGGGGRGTNFLSWPFLIGVSLLAAVLLALVIVLALRNGDDDGNTAVELLNQALADLPTEMQNGTKLGSDDAPVKLIQFEDFQCPHCLTYTLNIEPFLVEEFVKAGLLQIEFRHYPVVGIRESVTAAVGAECAAEQNRMFEYANRLFAKQAEDGFYPDEGVFSEESLVEIAGELGLDTDAFAACQAGPDAFSRVARGQSAAQAYGFRGTPNFVINDLPVQAPPQTIEAWREMIEEAIAAATAEDEAEPDGDGESEPDAEDDDGS
ncbi:MAG: thioredoxin domain-containing protein [Chloroflexi bacterium]|nr:thioredoxin domain-containing protein [Chloroflexota bacterium]